MTSYAFVLTVKYAKEWWVSEEYKITNNNFTRLTARDRYPVTAI